MRLERESLRALYPFAPHWLDLGGVRMHYVDEGEGEPVVMVHGNPTWSFYYRNLALALRGTHRCIVPDHVGCGFSDRPGDAAYRYTLESRARDLRCLLDSLKLERFTLVVHDWGGMIGLAAALRRPQQVARLVILNTSAFLLPRGKRLPSSLWFIRHVPMLPALLVRGLNAFARGAVRYGAMRPLPRDVRRAYIRPYHSWRDSLATLRFVQDIPLRAGDASYELSRWVDERLATLRDRPTLICWGRRDFVFDDHFLNEWRRRLPAADVHVFEDAGHLVLEDAGERIIPLVRAFLDGSPAARAATVAEASR